MVEKEMNDNEIGLEFLNRVFKFFLKNVVWILIIAIAFGGAVFGLTKKFVPEKFVSQLKLYASANYLTEDIASANTEFTYTKSIVETYSTLLKTNDYLDAVSEYTGTLRRNQLSGAISISVLKDTNILQITVTTESPEMSLQIANAVAQTSGQYISNIDENATIKVVETPEKPTSPSGPNIILYTLLGAVIGALVGVGVGLLREITDTKLRSENQLKERYDFPILSSIPEFTQQ